MVRVDASTSIFVASLLARIAADCIRKIIIKILIAGVLQEWMLGLSLFA